MSGNSFFTSPGMPGYDPIRNSVFGISSSPSTPATAVPTPTPSEPITAANAEVIQAKMDLRRQALKKRGFSSTIHAGDTGGWTPPSPGNPQVGGAMAGSRTLGA